MSKMSIIIPVHDRAEQLNRTLNTYANQTYEDFELIIIDDNNADNSYELCHEFSTLLNIKYFNLENVNSKWPVRGPSTAFMAGVERPDGDLVFFTHAEIMLKKDALAKVYLHAEANPLSRISLNTFWISEADYQMVDSVDWIIDVDLLQTLPAFFQSNRRNDNNGGIVFGFSGMSRERWQWFGWLRRSERFGMDDRDIVEREHCLRRLGLYNGPHVPASADCSCYHQWHKPIDIVIKSALMSPGYHYTTEHQARLLEGNN